jgi:putative sterol carrier protein
MAEIDLTNFSSMDTKEFARLIKQASTSDLNNAIAGDKRDVVLDEIFNRMPSLFRADRAGSTNTVIHWRLSDTPEGGRDTYELVIADGKCVCSPKPEHDPKLDVTMTAVDFLKIVSGNGNPVMMFMTGKLKAKGDLGLAAKIGDLFDIPKA